MMKHIQKKLSERLSIDGKKVYFMPPDGGDKCWDVGAETFTRQEVAFLLWTQIAMISNDLKCSIGNDLDNFYAILNDPRIPKF